MLEDLNIVNKVNSILISIIAINIAIELYCIGVIIIDIT